MSKFDADIEQQLIKMVVDSEYVIGVANQSIERDDFEEYISLFDAEHTDREYEWESDIFIPEFASQMLMQSAIDVSQYFQTRDFVDVYIEDGDPEAKLSAEATKELINRTLNRRKLYHYLKYIRAKNINSLLGHVDIKCWWEQETQTEYDIDGFGEIQEEYEIVTKDCFNYEVLDPRNVFTDRSYVNSMQEREWIIVRGSKTLEQLEEKKETFKYFNLDMLKKDAGFKPQEKTETFREVEEDVQSFELPTNAASPRFDILERYGKFWVVNNKDGEARPGINNEGEVLPGAYRAEVLMTFAKWGSNKVLIQFHHTPYLDADGDTYRPLIRGLCYVHPTRDGGVGDGKYARELQIGINDTFNVSSDRTMLATMPTLKGKAYAVEDTDTVRIQPNHMIELNDPNDIQEMEFKDNTQAAMQQMALLTEKMSQATAIYPTTMGQTPAYASTTATALAGADQRTNQRTNYKSMTFEYTLLVELYWMIQQMTWAYAKPETGHKLMGDKVFDFNPLLNYTYKPLSQSIETEVSKQSKIQTLNTLLSYVVNVQHPGVANIINTIISKIMLLMGDEHSDLVGMLLDPGVPMNQPDQQGPQSGTGATPKSNQYGVPQQSMEQMVRSIQQPTV